jgi:hypothetical protein
VDVAELFPPVDTLRVYPPPVRGSAGLPMIHESSVLESSAAIAKKTGKKLR